jgi:hypothetical protein
MMLVGDDPWEWVFILLGAWYMYVLLFQCWHQFIIYEQRVL